MLSVAPSHYIRNIFVAALLTLAACDAVSTPYVYTPQVAGEQPATINSSAKIYSGKATVTSLITKEPPTIAAAKLEKIGDKYVRAGMAAFTSDKNDTHYQISPGKRQIGLFVSAGAAATSINLTLDAKPGENYMLGIAANPAGNAYSVWIQDSAGARLVGAQFSVQKSYSTFVIPAHR